MHQHVSTQLAAQLDRVPALSAQERRTLEQAVDRLLGVADPAKVILFGSRARGQARSSSDMDVLVVLPTREALDAQWDRMLDAVHGLRPRIDVVVTTAEEFEWRSQVPFFVQHYAAKDGYILYEHS